MVGPEIAQCVEVAEEEEEASHHILTKGLHARLTRRVPSASGPPMGLRIQKPVAASNSSMKLVSTESLVQVTKRAQVF